MVGLSDAEATHMFTRRQLWNVLVLLSLAAPLVDGMDDQ
jgi:hypothetical protein